MSAVRGLRAGFGFDGGTAYIYAPFDWFGTGDWTIALWFYHAIPRRDQILRHAATAPGRTGYFLISHWEDGRVEWASRASNTNNLHVLFTSTPVPFYRWVHYAVRRRGTVVNIFVDGVRDANWREVPLTEEFAYDGIMLGRVLFTNWWLGLIGPVLIYTRALSDGDIAMLRDGYVPRDGLALYYDPSIPLRPDGRVEDLSGNGRHGTIVGPVRVGVYRAARTVAPARVLPKAR